jgi:hypothetical protein
LLTNKQGMIRGLSISERREVPQQPTAPLMALFGMELDPKNVAGVHGAAEFRSIDRDGGHILGPITAEVIRMEEVEPGPRLELVEQSIRR